MLSHKQYLKNQLKKQQETLNNFLIEIKVIEESCYNLRRKLTKQLIFYKSPDDCICKE